MEEGVQQGRDTSTVTGQENRQLWIRRCSYGRDAFTVIVDGVQWPGRPILSNRWEWKVRWDEHPQYQKMTSKTNHFHLPLLHNFSSFLNTLFAIVYVPVLLLPIYLSHCYLWKASSITCIPLTSPITVDVPTPLLWTISHWSECVSSLTTDHFPLPNALSLLLWIWLLYQCTHSPSNVDMPLSLPHILSHYYECACPVAAHSLWILWMCLLDHLTLPFADAHLLLYWGCASPTTMHPLKLLWIIFEKVK